MAVAETSLLERAFFSFPDGHEGGRKVIDISVEGSNEEYMHCGSKGGIGGENEEGVSGKGAGDGLLLTLLSPLLVILRVYSSPSAHSAMKRRTTRKGLIFGETKQKCY